MTTEPVTAPAPAVTADQSILGPRIGAAVIDIILVFVLFLIVAATLGDFGDGNASVSGFPAFLLLLIVLGYYFVADAYLGGRTLGKAIVGLSVVADDGSTLRPGPAAARTLLRIVDGLPAFYLVGFIVVLASKGKRIGDMAAGSKVVRSAG
jgi:uncharacterized RDD family membrane protein YckC